MNFQQSREEILDEIIQETSKHIPQISHPRTGGVLRLFLEVVASFFHKLTLLMQNLQPNLFLQTATGNYLDLKAEELGLKRRVAIKAQGWVLFVREKNDEGTLIPKGKLLNSRSDAQGRVFRFAVMEDTVLPPYAQEFPVLVEAEETGILYNHTVISELLSPISGVNHVRSSENWISRPGADRESDDRLRLRCLAFWKGISGANKDAYIHWAKSVEGAGSVCVVPEARGLGTLDVVMTAQGGLQPNKTLLDTIQQYIDERKPIGANCLVRSPSEIVISLYLKVVFHLTSQSERAPLEEEIQNYFHSLEIGQDFESSALVAQLMSVPGVKSIRIEGEESIRISALQIARLGDVTIELYQAKEI